MELLIITFLFSKWLHIYCAECSVFITFIDSLIVEVNSCLWTVFTKREMNKFKVSKGVSGDLCPTFDMTHVALGLGRFWSCPSNRRESWGLSPAHRGGGAPASALALWTGLVRGPIWDSDPCCLQRLECLAISGSHLSWDWLDLRFEGKPGIQ